MKRLLVEALSGLDLRSEIGAMWTRGLWKALVPAVSCWIIVGVLQVHRRQVQAQGETRFGVAAEREAVEWVLLDTLEADGGEEEL